jgi:H+/Cl- antiporter ClcA
LRKGSQVQPRIAILKPISAAITIGTGGLFEPRARGVGYDVIADLLQGRATVALIIGITPFEIRSGNR